MQRTASRKSSAVALLGSQEPTFRTCPDYVRSDGLDAFDTCTLGGVTLDEWQARLMDDWLARDPSGRWAAPSCACSVPRQNGKTLLTVARAAYGTLVLGETVIYTAHLQKTATETFEEMRSFFEHPSISKYVAEIRTALGREQIALKNGARVKFLARTRNGGRGQHGSLLVFDEAQELTDLQLSSFLPAISATRNPQTVYIGTPPDQSCEGTVFERMRTSAHEGTTSRTAWSEWAVDEIGDVRDQTRWARTNPSFGIRISPDTVAAEAEQLSPDTFARERLGWWSPRRAGPEPVIDATAWASCATDAPLEPQKAAYGVKFTPDGAEVVLAVAEVAERLTHVEVIERQGMGRGTAWLADWLAERTAKASCVVIDGRAGSQALVERLDGRCPRGFVRVARMQDVTAAAQMTLDAINGQTLTWFAPQRQLDESARGAIRRQIGSGGGWGFGGDDPAPIEACSLALWGVHTSKRDPNRKQRIG